MVPVTTWDGRRRRVLGALRAASKNGGSTTAHALAAELGISVRTVYRDLDVLRAEGSEIAGRTGVGLRLGEPLDIEARVRATAAGVRSIAEEPSARLEENGKGQTLRAGSRDVLVQVVLRAAGEVEVISPEKLRREIRERARDVARKHKD